MTTLMLAEAPGSLNDAQMGRAESGRRRALLIRAGWGSSGYYSAEVLRRDGPRTWPAGTQMYLDHPSVSEAAERPERSVRDLASVIVTDPVWDQTEQGLVAEVQVFPQWRDLLNEEFASAIGLSIRAYGEAEQGTAEGREGPIITSLTEGISIDWVTRAGAGGRVLELIEAARGEPAGRPLAEARNIGHWLESRLHLALTQYADDMFGQGRITRDERIAMSSAIGDGLTAYTAALERAAPQLYQRDLYQEPEEVSEARRRFDEAAGITANDLRNALSDAVRNGYGGDGLYTWVRDNTDQWVVFSVEDDTDCDLYQQTYTIDPDSGAVTLTGEPAEVVARTTYEPAPAAQPDPGDQQTGQPVTENAPGVPPADQETEGAMPEITEEQARQLEEAANLRTQLEQATASLTEATTRLDQTNTRVADLETRLSASDARNQALENDRTARALIGETLAASGLPTRAHARVTEAVCRGLPTSDNGTLDRARLSEATTAAIDEERSYVAALAEESGAGRPRGLGRSDITEVSDADIEKQLADTFKSIGLDERAAATAARGRG